jgi:heavy metal translocating P-type ATPase
MAFACSIIHSIRGRVRFRIPALRTRESLPLLLRTYLESLSGVTEVSINRTCASAVLVFDPHRWNDEFLRRHIAALDEEFLRYFERNPPDRKRVTPALEESGGFELFLSTAGIIIGWCAESLAAPILPFLLLGSAWPMVSRSYDAFARKGELTVDVLDASAATVLTIQGEIRMALFMVWLINLGDFIRDLTVTKARRAVEEVLAYQASPAWVVRNGETIQVPLEEIVVGDVVVVYPGERIPVDGTVLMGRGTVDQHALTGESLPVEMSEGHHVFASTVVHEGKLYLRAERIGAETEAAKIVRMIEAAPAHETRMQNYAEQWANELVPYSFFGAVASGMLMGGVHASASILIIDYGTGIRIAAPTTVLASMTRALQSGILIKSGRALEQLAGVDAVVLDKTGTLTFGTPEVVHVTLYGCHSEDKVLSLAAASEQRLTHPVAQAIVQEAVRRNLPIPARTSSEYSIGLGVESVINGDVIHVGCSRYMMQKGIELSDQVMKDLKELDEQAISSVCVAVDGEINGLIAYADPLRPEAADVIQELRDLGVKEIVMLTGDHGGVARRVAEAIGISEYVSEALPADKVSVVKRLQQQGRRVAVIGDGINDSPALANADVGIAVEGGTEVARETAQVVLLNGGLWKLPLAIQLGRDAMKLIRQNWSIISVPNTVALALAIAGLIGPGASTLLSNGSSILATANALRPLLNGGAIRGAINGYRSATIARSTSSSAIERTRMLPTSIF